MRQLPPDDFYDLPEEERKKLIGKVFKHSRNLYFPIGLNEKDTKRNYGVAQGILCVTPIRKTEDHVKWFKVGAVSPDDLDIDLDFQHDTHFRQEVIAYIQQMNKQNVTYKSVLQEISSHFNAGRLYN